MHRQRRWTFGHGLDSGRLGSSGGSRLTRFLVLGLAEREGEGSLFLLPWLERDFRQGYQRLFSALLVWVLRRFEFCAQGHLVHLAIPVCRQSPRQSSGLSSTGFGRELSLRVLQRSRGIELEPRPGRTGSTTQKVGPGGAKCTGWLRTVQNLLLWLVQHTD